MSEFKHPSALAIAVVFGGSVGMAAASAAGAGSSTGFVLGTAITFLFMAAAIMVSRGMAEQAFLAALMTRAQSLAETRAGLGATRAGSVREALERAARDRMDAGAKEVLAGQAKYRLRRQPTTLRGLKRTLRDRVRFSKSATDRANAQMLLSRVAMVERMQAGSDKSQQTRDLLNSYRAQFSRVVVRKPAAKDRA